MPRRRPVFLLCCRITPIFRSLLSRDKPPFSNVFLFCGSLWSCKMQRSHVSFPVVRYAVVPQNLLLLRYFTFFLNSFPSMTSSVYDVIVLQRQHCKCKCVQYRTPSNSHHQSQYKETALDSKDPPSSIQDGKRKSNARRRERIHGPRTTKRTTHLPTATKARPNWRRDPYLPDFLAPRV